LFLQSLLKKREGANKFLSRPPVNNKRAGTWMSTSPIVDQNSHRQSTCRRKGRRPWRQNRVLAYMLSCKDRCAVNTRKKKKKRGSRAHPFSQRRMLIFSISIQPFALKKARGLSLGFVEKMTTEGWVPAAYQRLHGRVKKKGRKHRRRAVRGWCQRQRTITCARGRARRKRGGKDTSADHV